MRILLTGATGFVGRHLWPALREQGYQVRCLTRNVDQARARWPEREWVEGDLARPETVRGALSGCDAAYYLVHGMAEGDPGFRRHERASAHVFRDAAAAVGIGRIIYLGGVAPRGRPSEHLASRLEVGETLRGGSVPALELRASMIVGEGSLSWQIVRDLAARLPVMVLPRWLRSRTQPIGIDDVVQALVRSLNPPMTASAWHDLPGPDALSGEEILGEVARLMGLKPPLMIRVPFLSLRLSSLWLRLVTRAPYAVARELAMGLTEDLLARDDAYWRIIGHARRLRFAEAARRALGRRGEARSAARARGFWEIEERLVARLRGRGGARPTPPRTGHGRAPGALTGG